MEQSMKASDIAAPQIGQTVYLPETEDAYAVIGRLDSVMLGPRPNITLTIGGDPIQVPPDQDVEFLS
jgi:hypothetical protein